jgi:hypothetical protein
MKHFKTFESFLNEATVAKRALRLADEKGWGPTTGGSLGYGATIKYSGGSQRVLALLPVEDKVIGRTMEVRQDYESNASGSVSKFKDNADLTDFIDGIKGFIDMLKNAVKEYDKLPQNLKSFGLWGAENTVHNVEKLAPLSKIIVGFLLERVKSKTPNEDAKVIMEEAKSVVEEAIGKIAGSYDIKVSVTGGSLIELEFKVNV